MKYLTLPVAVVFVGLGLVALSDLNTKAILLWIFTGTVLIWLLLKIRHRNKSKRWITVCEGVYDWVEYGNYRYLTDAGDVSMRDKTIIHLSNGNPCVLSGRHHIGFPKGTIIRVLENGLGQRRIEKSMSP